ncbi:hypothetical protein PVB08_22390 [Bacillus thuringiensis]
MPEISTGTLFIYLIGDYMNSPIKLPPLPDLPEQDLVDVIYSPDGDEGAIFEWDEEKLKAWATAYAEQAVRDALASVPVAGEAQKPVAWMLVGRLKNSEPKFTLADPAGIYESVYAPLYAAPQASSAECPHLNLLVLLGKLDTAVHDGDYGSQIKYLSELGDAVRALIPENNHE